VLFFEKHCFVFKHDFHKNSTHTHETARERERESGGNRCDRAVATAAKTKTERWQPLRRQLLSGSNRCEDNDMSGSIRCEDNDRAVATAER